MKKYKIDDICQVISGGTPSTSEPSFWGDDYMWLTPKDLSTNKNKYIEDSALSISELGLKHSSSKLVPIGSVLLSSRAPIGYMGIAKVQLCTNQGFKSLICNDKLVNNEYLYYLLLSNVENLKAISTGSTFLELSTSTLNSFEVFLPSITEQQHIVNPITFSLRC